MSSVPAGFVQSRNVFLLLIIFIIVIICVNQVMALRIIKENSSFIDQVFIFDAIVQFIYCLFFDVLDSRRNRSYHRALAATLDIKFINNSALPLATGRSKNNTKFSWRWDISDY